MRQLAPEYLAELGRQLAFLSAVMGGFAATFLATLLVSANDKRTSGWAAGSAAVSAAAFVVAVIAAAMLSIVTHPNAPAGLAAASKLDRARIIGTLAFFLGVYAMLLSLGLCGWIRSTKLGVVTSAASLLAATAATWAAVGF